MKNSKIMPIYSFVLLGIIIRIIMAIIHFTHMDDIGVVNYIIDLLHNTEGTEIDIVRKFSERWTYGPLQIFITQKLVNANMSYALNLFMGRLPSLVCGICFIIVIYKSMQKTQLNEKYAMMLIICIISLSWENIIYSAQMEPYAIGILFSSIIVYFIISKFYDSWNKTIPATFLFSIGCYAQYQIFILVFAVYVVMFLGNLKNKSNLIRVTFAGIVNFASSLPLVVFLLRTGKLLQGVNSWNIGKDGMFRFQMLMQRSLFENIKYFVAFFCRNIFLCFKYLFLSDSLNYIANILTVLLLVLAGLGIYYVHKNKEYCFFALFHDAVALILLVMVIKGNLTFGPSRHILFMEPIWIVLMYFGGVQFLKIQNIKLDYGRILNTITILAALLFVLSLPQEIATRKNLISEKYICNLIDKYEPQFVFSEGNLDDLFLFNVDGFANKSASIGNGWIQNADIGVKPQIDNTIIIMSKNYPIEIVSDAENYMRQQLENLLIYLDLDTEWADINKYKILYEKEVQTDAEVEYARKYYWNYPNELHLYVLKFCGN